jgi:hypothetical protein
LLRRSLQPHILTGRRSPHQHWEFLAKSGLGRQQKTVSPRCQCALAGNWLELWGGVPYNRAGCYPPARWSRVAVGPK